MKTKQDRWDMLTPEQHEQNIISQNVKNWLEDKKKRDQSRERKQFTQHFNSVGDKLERARA